MSDRLLTLQLLFAFLAFTLAMTHWASRATRTAADFHVANHQLRPWQNGIAMAGAFISAVTVLGVPGLIALTGYDGVFYFIGTLLSFAVIQVLVAEPFRNAGRFTMADALVPRLRERPVRLAMATSTISVAIIYMVAQIIGAGVLARLLLPISGTVLGMAPEVLAIVVVGLVMTIHVAYGGMLLITWVQIVKMVLLLLGVIVTALLVLSRFGYSFDAVFAAADGAAPAALATALGLPAEVRPLGLVAAGRAG
jgi:cation/acetate symporter